MIGGGHVRRNSSGLAIHTSCTRVEKRKNTKAVHALLQRQSLEGILAPKENILSAAYRRLADGRPTADLVRSPMHTLIPIPASTILTPDHHIQYQGRRVLAPTATTPAPLWTPPASNYTTSGSDSGIGKQRALGVLFCSPPPAQILVKSLESQLQ